MLKQKKRLYRVVLVYRGGLTRSVFERAYDKSKAERRALKKNPDAIGIDRSPYPQN